MSQKQIFVEKDEEVQKDDELDMRYFLKDMKNQHQRLDYATNKVQQQDKRLVGVNENLDQYNKEVTHGEDLTDVVNRGVFSSIFHGIKDLFKSKDKEEKKNKLSHKDKKILEKAKNKGIDDNNKINEDNNLKFKEDGEWSIIKKDNGEINKDEKYDEDEVIKESIKEVQSCIQSAKNLHKNVKDSIEVAKVTNKHLDKSSHHVKKAIKKMEDED